MGPEVSVTDTARLAEAWDAGGVGVDGGATRTEADRGPAEWLPPSLEALCRYGTESTATKLRWGWLGGSTEGASAA